MGEGTEPGVLIGPLIDENAANDVIDIVNDAVAKGAQVVVGGGRSDLGACFVEPTVLTGVSDDMRMFREENLWPDRANL